RTRLARQPGLRLSRMLLACNLLHLRRGGIGVADTLPQLFADAGNTLRPTATGFRCGHEPVHSSSSGECVNIDPAKAVWYCHSCQRGGDVVAAVMSLQDLSRAEAEALVQAQNGSSTGAAAPKETLAD